MKKITRIIISLMMCMALVLPALTDAIVSQAASRETVYEEYTNVADYRGETKSYPTKDGYLFAGWYEKQGDSYQPMDAADADAATTAYAKFVDQDVLAAKCQLQNGTTASSATANMRVLTSVDSLYYDAINFNVVIGGIPVAYTSTTAYETIIGKVDGANVTYKANEVFASSSDYFVAFVLNNIPTSEFGAPIEISSSWTTLDGTTVSGATRSITINNELPNWNAGIDFEKAMDFGAVSGQGEWNDFAVSRVNYASAGIPALGDGGSYVMKATNSNSLWPSLQLNFGETLEAGTKITFMAYGKVEGSYAHDRWKFGFKGTSGNTDIGEGFKFNEWSVVTLTLPEAVSAARLFWNLGWATDDAETISSCELYIDNMIIETESAADITKGLGFDSDAQKALFTGVGIEGRDATIQRTTYGALGIDAPENGGTYALKLSHASNYWPTFRINFGKELAAGTEITFQAYGKIFGESNYNVCIFEFLAGGEATAQFQCDTWTELTITLSSACSYIDLFWNIDRAEITSSSASGAIYIDNMIAVEPVNMDIINGINFENSEHEAFVTGDSSQEWRTFATERVTYADAGISAPEDGNSYAMKLTQSGNLWPAFKMDFGKTLPAGTQISFKAYGKIIGFTGTPVRTGTKFEIHAGDNSGVSSTEFACDEWNTVTLLLKAEASSVQLCWNAAWYAGDDATISSTELYIDDLIAVEPILPVGDFTEGVGFETRGNEALFAGQGIVNRDATIERVTYAELGVDAPTDGGSYALKLSHESNYWPTFRINFGKELAAGTVITFQAYGKILGTSLYNYSIFEFMTGGAATAQFQCDEWTELTITLPSACEYVDLFWNIDRATITSESASGEVYIDNMIATEPVEVDVLKGIDFEYSEHESFVVADTDGNYVWRTFTVERVAYSETGISAPEDGNSYAMKLTQDGNLWPAFKFDFGKTLPAGTQISFKAYGKIIGFTGTYAGDTKFEIHNGDNKGIYSTGFGCDEWHTVTIVLKAEASSVQLCWNVALATGDNATISATELYIDNLIAVEPLVLDLTAGTGFEREGEEGYITGGGYWNDFAISRVTYADAGVTALDGGDSYVMKMTNGNSLWPSIQFNFGKTLPAGTKITFKAYGKINGDFTYNRSKFEFHHDSGSGNAGNEFKLNEWCDVTIILPMETSYIQMCWNMDHSGGVEEGKETGELYIDNMIAVEPIALDLVSGTGFELEGEDGYVTTPSISGRDATIARTTYDALGISAPTDGGSYALKLSHASNKWPTFRINFGKELAAGTKITFQAYGKIFEESESNSCIFEYLSGGDATAQFNCDTWTELTITLSSACSYVDLFWNVDRAGITSESASSEIYIDNMIATEP